MAVAPKIPRGVVLDLLDLYDLNIQILSAYFENEYNIPPKLNSYSIEVTKEIYSIAAKWHINFEGLASCKCGNDFDFPFHCNGNLILETMWRNQGPSFEEKGLYPNEVMDQMHTTYRLIRDLLRSERVNAKEIERDDVVQDIITGTKHALSELETKRIERITKKATDATTAAKIRLEGHKVSFDDDLPAIIIDGKHYPLPAFTMAHYLARVMFEYRAGEAVDWSLVEKQMAKEEGHPVDERMVPAKRRKRLWDTANRLNERVRELLNTDDSLIQFTELTIRRLY